MFPNMTKTFFLLLLLLCQMLPSQGQALSLPGPVISSKLVNLASDGNNTYLTDTFGYFWGIDLSSGNYTASRLFVSGVSTALTLSGGIAVGKSNGTKFTLGTWRTANGAWWQVALNSTGPMTLSNWGNYSVQKTSGVPNPNIHGLPYCTWGEQNWLGGFKFTSSVVAGTGTAGISGIPGYGLQVQLNGPQGMAISTNGTYNVIYGGYGLFLYNTTTTWVSQLWSTGTIYSAAFWDDDTLIFQDTFSANIVKYSISSNTTTDFAGGGSDTGSTCNGFNCSFGTLKSFSFNPVDGCMYFVDSTIYVIRKMYPNATIVTVAGTAGSLAVSDANTVAGDVLLSSNAQGIAFDTVGNLYWGDSRRVRKISYGLDGISTSSQVSIVVGGGAAGAAFQKSSMTSTYFAGISDLKFDSNGLLYVVDGSFITMVNITNWSLRIQDENSYVYLSATRLSIDKNDVMWTTASNRLYKITPSPPPSRFGVFVCAATSSTTKGLIIFSFDAYNWYTEYTSTVASMNQCKYSSSVDKFVCIGNGGFLAIYSRGDVIGPVSGFSSFSNFVSMATDGTKYLMVNGTTFASLYENGVTSNFTLTNALKYVTYFNGVWWGTSGSSSNMYYCNTVSGSWLSLSLTPSYSSPTWNSLELISNVGVMVAGGTSSGPQAYLIRPIVGYLGSGTNPTFPNILLEGSWVMANFTVTQGVDGSAGTTWFIDNVAKSGNSRTYNYTVKMDDNGKVLRFQMRAYYEVNAYATLNIVSVNYMNNVVFGGDQMVGGQVVVQTSWNRTVYVYGNASIPVGNGLAWYSGGNGTSGLNFTYNVVNGDWDLFLGSIISISGTLKDEYGFVVNQTYVFGIGQSLQVSTTTTSMTTTTTESTTTESTTTTTESSLTSSSLVETTDNLPVATSSVTSSSTCLSLETTLSTSVSESTSFSSSSSDGQTSSSTLSVESSTSSITSSMSLETTLSTSFSSSVSESTSFSISSLETTETSTSSSETTSISTSSSDAQTSTSMETTSSSLSSTEITSPPSTSSSVISSGLSTNSLSSSSQTTFVSLSSSSFSQSSSLSSVTTKSLSSSSVPTSTSSVSSSVTTSHSLSIDANSLSTVSSSMTSTFKSLSVAPSTSISSSKVVSSSSIQMSSSSGVSTKALTSGVSTTSIVSGSSISSTQNIGTTSKFVSTIPPTKSSTIPSTIISTSILKTSTASVVVASGVDPSLVANATPLTIPASDVVQVSPTPATNVPGLTFTPQVVVEIPIQASNGKIVALQVDGLTFSSQETGLKVGLINGLWNKVNHDLYQMGTSVSLANNGLTGNVYIWLSNVQAGSVVTVNSELKMWTEIVGRKRANTVGWIKAKYDVKVIAKVGSSSIKNSSTKKSSLKSSSSTTTRKISTTGKITSTAKVSAYKTTTTTTTTRRTDIIVAEYCAPGKKYHNSLNCCCAPAKTITRTRTMQGKSGIVETGVVVFDRQVAFDHLCPVKCPSRPKTNGKPVLCCMPRVTKTVTKTKFI